MREFILVTEHSRSLPPATEILAWDTLTDPAELKRALKEVRLSMKRALGHHLQRIQVYSTFGASS